ncbi:MAG TPA: phosphoribosylformylglycinamidine synthase subunit PurS [Nitrososphaeraceae archaeon]|jgi:phosphoribosylformylglycinamidine synthase
MNTNTSKSRFIVLVNIENKPYVSDPEGETILRDLIMEEGYSVVESVRTAKSLKMIVRAKNPKQAEKMVMKICEKLRIFNPIISSCTVNVVKSLP